MNGYGYANHNPVSYNDSSGDFAIVIVIPVLIIVLIIAWFVRPMYLQSYPRKCRRSNGASGPRASGTSSAGPGSTWSSSYKVIVTTIVMMVKLITVLVARLIVKAKIIYRTIVKHYPDKRVTRNNHRRDGGDGRSAHPRPKPRPPVVKPKPPRVPVDNDRQQPKRKKGPQQTQRRLGDGPDKDTPLYRGVRSPDKQPWKLKEGEAKLQDGTNFVRTNAGPSTDTNAANLVNKNFEPWQVDKDTIDSRLRIMQTGNNPTHYEIMPKAGQQMTKETFQNLLDHIQLTPPHP